MYQTQKKKIKSEEDEKEIKRRCIRPFYFGFMTFALQKGFPIHHFGYCVKLKVLEQQFRKSISI